MEDRQHRGSRREMRGRETKRRPAARPSHKGEDSVEWVWRKKPLGGRRRACLQRERVPLRPPSLPAIQSLRPHPSRQVPPSGTGDIHYGRIRWWWWCVSPRSQKRHTFSLLSSPTQRFFPIGPLVGLRWRLGWKPSPPIDPKGRSSSLVHPPSPRTTTHTRNIGSPERTLHEAFWFDAKDVSLFSR